MKRLQWCEPALFGLLCVTILAGCGGGGGGGSQAGPGTDAAAATVDWRGATLTTPSGLDITVPAGAIERSADVRVERLSPDYCADALGDAGLQDGSEAVGGFNLTTSAPLQTVAFKMPASGLQPDRSFLLVRVAQDASGPAAELAQWAIAQGDSVATDASIVPIVRSPGPEAGAFSRGGTYVVLALQRPQFPLLVNTAPGALVTTCDSSGIRSAADSQGAAIVNVQARAAAGEQQGILVAAMAAETRQAGPFGVARQLVAVPQDSRTIVDFGRTVDLSHATVAAANAALAPEFCKDENTLKDAAIDAMLKAVASTIAQGVNLVLADGLAQALEPSTVILNQGPNERVRLSVQAILDPIPMNLDLGARQIRVIGPTLVNLHGFLNEVDVESANVTLVMESESVAVIAGNKVVEVKPGDLLAEWLVQPGQQGTTDARALVDATKFGAKLAVRTELGGTPICSPVPIVRPQRVFPEPKPRGESNAIKIRCVGPFRVFASGPYEVWATNLAVLEASGAPSRNYFGAAEFTDHIRLGSGSANADYPGGYRFYVVLAPQIFKLDALQLPDGSYLGLAGGRQWYENVHLPYRLDGSGNLIGDVREYMIYDNVKGAPDGLTCDVGNPEGGPFFTGGDFEGYVVVMDPSWVP